MVGVKLEMVVGTQGAALWVELEVGRVEGVREGKEEEVVTLEEVGVVQVVGAR